MFNPRIGILPSAVDEEKLLYRELRELRTVLERIEALMEKWLIDIEEPPC